MSGLPYSGDLGRIASFNSGRSQSLVLKSLPDMYWTDHLIHLLARTRHISHMPSNTLPNPLRQLMIIRIRGRLIQKANSFLIQLHEITLERQITNSRHIFLSSSPIILYKQCQTPRRAKERSLDGVFLNLVGLCDSEGLCGIERGSGFEIDVVSVAEDLYCGGCGVGS